MFGSRTTVKKVRNSLTWFSHKQAKAKKVKLELLAGVFSARLMQVTWTLICKISKTTIIVLFGGIQLHWSGVAGQTQQELFGQNS